ncbi:trace amine-associated receptor 13c-like [Myripristis murdjan]|uniref:trace amine-associated receptor 13c-like n=1 Tax=Myripristis murdjan TaxID=586833 RepID=UPI0011763CB9|nr:trace amine-associated receptor 13c-like [Myripristis murdjan]
MSDKKEIRQRVLFRELPDLSSFSSPPHSLMMETPEGAELCFPQLLNTSCGKPKPPESEAMIIHILMSFIALLTVALNLLVIISISHYRQLHTPTNLVLLSLAVSDFLVGLLLIPIKILLTWVCWFLGEHMCAVRYCTSFIVTIASVGNMVLISVDRYVAICHPLHYPTKVTQSKAKVCVCVCWIGSVLSTSYLLKDLLRQPNRYMSCHGECVIVIDLITGTADFVMNFFLPITAIIVLYIRVFVVAVSQARAMRSHIVSVTLQPSGTGTAKKSELKAARTLGVVVFVFLICLFPYYSPSLAGQDYTVGPSYLSFGIWLMFCNSCVNPLIYAFFYPWFRKCIKHIVTLQILQPDSCEANIL